MRDGAAGGRNERRWGRNFGGKDVYFWDMWLTGGSHVQFFCAARRRRALRQEADTGVIGAYIRLEIASALFGAHQCSFSVPSPKYYQNAGGHALTGGSKIEYSRSDW
jgi:hypothetical protein